MVLAACSSTKKGIQEAKALEDAGMFQSAVKKYEELYAADQAQVALIGINRISQMMIDQMCAQAASLCMVGSHEEGLRKFEEAKAYYELRKIYEVHLPVNLVTQIEQCKASQVQLLLDQAEAQVMNLELVKAQTTLERLFRLDYDNSAAQALQVLLQIIPIYNEGESAFDLELWPAAYAAFDKVCRIDASYREAKAKRDLAMINGSFSLAYIIKEGVAPNKIAQGLATEVKGELLNLRNPFLELLEHDDLEVLLKEQKSGLSAEFDNENGPQAGKFRRANYLLYGEIITFKANLDPEKKQKCDCAKSLGIYSDKVECFEWTQKRSLELSLRFQLVDAESGKIYLADVIHLLKSDTGGRFDFEVDKKISLMSPTLKKDHEVDLSQMKKTKEDALLSEAELQNALQHDLAMEIAKRVKEFKPY
jgi:Curli production assembly/transport component CsgG